MRLSLRSRALDVNAALQQDLAADTFNRSTIESEFDELDRQFSALQAERQGIELAIGIAKFGENLDAAPSFLATADPYRELAVKYPKKAIARIEAIDEIIDGVRSRWTLARNQRQLAREEHAQRLASTFKPRHRKLVKAVADALTALSTAVAAEQDLHREFQSQAHDIAALPDFGGQWRSTLLGDPRSAASTWIRAARNMGYLDG
jgi:hypothetical protein